MIETIHSEPNAPVYRDNRELMLDYRIPSQGEPYLVATSLFFRSHSAIPVNTMDQPTLEPYLMQIRLLLLHEVAHVLGIGKSEKTDYKARVFALNLRDQLSKNNVVCSAAEVPDNYQGKVPDFELTGGAEYWLRKSTPEHQKPTDEEIAAEVGREKAAPYYWIWNRPTGFGLQTFRNSHLNEISDADGSWLGRIFAGQPDDYTKFMYHPMLKISGPTTPALGRFFNIPYIIEDSSDPGFFMQPQYYDQFTIVDGNAKFSGAITMKMRSFSTGAIRPCTYGEQLVIPQNSKGSYDGQIVYTYTCPDSPINAYTYKDDNGKDVIVGNQPSDNGNGSIAVHCVESFPDPAKVLPQEFFGDGPFTNPDLIELQKSIDKL